MRKKVREATGADGSLSFYIDYADDGMDGGSPGEVMEALRRELAAAQRYGLRFNYDKMTVDPLAGHAFVGDLYLYEGAGLWVFGVLFELLSGSWRSSVRLCMACFRFPVSAWRFLC